jgi:hypothetical protein
VAARGDLLDQKQRDEQTPHSAIPVQERMDRLEVLVDEGALDELWELIPLVQELLPSREGFLHFVRWRWNIRRGLGRTPRRANPILRPSEFPRRRPLPSHPSHKALMQLPHKAERQRQTLKALQAVFQCRDVVSYLFHVVRVTIGRARADLFHQEIRQGCPRPLDAR